MFNMSEKDVDLDYELSVAECVDFLDLFDSITDRLLGIPTEVSSRQLRESRLLGGDYARLARTTIRNAGIIMGYSTELELFTAEKLVHDSDDHSVPSADETEEVEVVLIHEGQYYSWTADTISRSIIKSQGFGLLKVNEFGDSEVCLTGSFDSEIGGIYADSTSAGAELRNLVAPEDVLLSSDFGRLFDAKKILYQG